MTRIFLPLAWFALVLLVATLILGLSIEDLQTNHSPERLRWATVHRLAGLGTALAVGTQKLEPWAKKWRKIHWALGAGRGPCYNDSHSEPGLVPGSTHLGNVG